MTLRLIGWKEMLVLISCISFPSRINIFLGVLIAMVLFFALELCSRTIGAFKTHFSSFIVTSAIISLHLRVVS